MINWILSQQSAQLLALPHLLVVLLCACDGDKYKMLVLGGGIGAQEAARCVSSAFNYLQWSSVPYRRSPVTVEVIIAVDYPPCIRTASQSAFTL